MLYAFIRNFSVIGCFRMADSGCFRIHLPSRYQITEWTGRYGHFERVVAGKEILLLARWVPSVDFGVIPALGCSGEEFCFIQSANQSTSSSQYLKPVDYVRTVFDRLIFNFLEAWTTESSCYGSYSDCFVSLASRQGCPYRCYSRCYLGHSSSFCRILPHRFVWAR